MTVDDELVWTEEYTDRKLAGKIPFLTTWDSVSQAKAHTLQRFI